LRNYTGIAIVIGALAIAAYFVVNATDQTPSLCSGNWTDYFNPICWASSADSAASNELNTVLIILAFVVVAVVGLLAFGPQTGHIARAAAPLAIL
jgi:hypothetical protein